MTDIEEEDIVADNLLRNSDIVRGDGLSEAREQFNGDTIVLLLGLGLKGEEVQLFQKHDIGIDRFSMLSYSDLDYIGIKSPTKKEEVMNCIRKTKNQHKSHPRQGTSVDAEYCSEDAQAMENVLRHQQTLVKIIPYLKRNLNVHCGSMFFQHGISVNHTFEKVALCCVQQATQLHDQLYEFLTELEQWQSANQQQNNLHLKRKWQKWCMKWGFVALVAGSCVSLVVWGSRGGRYLPMHWLNTWMGK